MTVIRRPTEFRMLVPNQMGYDELDKLITINAIDTEHNNDTNVEDSPTYDTVTVGIHLYSIKATLQKSRNNTYTASSRNSTAPQEFNKITFLLDPYGRPGNNLFVVMTGNKANTNLFSKCRALRDTLCESSFHFARLIVSPI